MPLQQLIAERSDAIAPYQYAMSDIPGASVSRPTIELVSEKDGVARIKVVAGENTSNFDYVEVDGFWVAKSTADSWTANIEEANKKLAEISNGSDISGVLSAVIGPKGASLGMLASMQPVLDTMFAAQNEKDFHASLEPMMAMVGPMLAQLPSLMKRSRGGYGDDYDMGMDYDEGMEMDMDYEEEMMMEQAMMEQEMRNGGN
jgi:hypothetical protein